MQEYRPPDVTHVEKFQFEIEFNLKIVPNTKYIIVFYVSFTTFYLEFGFIIFTF